MTTRKPLSGTKMDPRQCIEREARSLVSSQYAGMREKPPVAMIEAYSALLDAAYDAYAEELWRLHSEEGATFAQIADALGVSRQAVQQQFARRKR